MRPLLLGGYTDVKSDSCKILSFQCCLRELDGKEFLVRYMNPSVNLPLAETDPTLTMKNMKRQSFSVLKVCHRFSCSMMNPYMMSETRQEKPLSSGCTSSVNGNGRSQALDDSLWWPRMTSCISIANHDSAELPLSCKQGGHVYVCMLEWEEEAEYAHILTLAKTLANYGVVTKWQNHNKNGIKSSSGNNVYAGTDSFHLFSLKWKWESSSIFLPKWYVCI